MKDSKYYKKIHKKEPSNKRWLTELLLCIIIILSSLIYVNFSESNKEKFTKNILEKNFDFSSINKLYKKYIATSNSNSKEETMYTMGDLLVYNSLEKTDNYYKLDVGNEYMVPFLKPGIIVYVGEKEDLGNTIIVQGNDGVDIWYSNVTLTDYTMYDYIEEGDTLGFPNNEYIYLTIIKDGTYLAYEEYFS